jgi:hypothetical protein
MLGECWGRTRGVKDGNPELAKQLKAKAATLGYVAIEPEKKKF